MRWPAGPVITTASLGALGWTAFERSMYGFSEYLPDIVNDDHPEYVIVGSGTSAKLFGEWVKKFGQPVYKGAYGSVYYFQNT